MRFDSGVIAALVGVLRNKDAGWTQEHESDAVMSACHALHRQIYFVSHDCAEEAVAAGVVPLLVTLLRDTEAGGCVQISSKVVLPVLLLLKSLCLHSSAKRLAAAAGAFEVLANVMRLFPQHCLLHERACDIMIACCFPVTKALEGPAKNVELAVAAGMPEAILAVHAELAEDNAKLEECTCRALCALLSDDNFARTASSFHLQIADALCKTLRRRLSSLSAQDACCKGLSKLCPALSSTLLQSMIHSGLVLLLTDVVKQHADCQNMAQINVVRTANSSLWFLLDHGGAAAAEQVMNAEVVEALMLTAATQAIAGLNGGLPGQALSVALEGVALMAHDCSAVAARATACGAQRLASSFPDKWVVCARRKTSDESSTVVQIPLGARAQEHAPCADVGCDLCAMRSTRCSLPTCAARANAAGVALKSASAADTLHTAAQSISVPHGRATRRYARSVPRSRRRAVQLADTTRSRNES